MRARVWSRLTLALYFPAERGTADSIAVRRPPRRCIGRSLTTYGVRTAIIPQPMSTPTAAGMIAPSVGMTDPTVAPLPRWASGISAMCGWMKGIPLAVTAWSRVLSARIDAQLIRRLLICCMGALSGRGGDRGYPFTQPGMRPSALARAVVAPADVATWSNRRKLRTFAIGCDRAHGGRRAHRRVPGREHGAGRGRRVATGAELPRAGLPADRAQRGVAPPAVRRARPGRPGDRGQRAGDLTGRSPVCSRGRGTCIRGRLPARRLRWRP